MKFRKHNLKSHWEKLGEKKNLADSFLVWAFAVIVCIIFICWLTSIVSAQDTTEIYKVKVAQTKLSAKTSIWFYQPIGYSDEGAPLSIVTGGGGGTSYAHKEVDSICRHRAACGYPQIEINYNLHSATDVLFATERCLFENMNDILIGRNYVLTHLTKFNNPDTFENYVSGLSWGSMVMDYLTYHTNFVDKNVGFYGAMLNVNMIDKDVPTLLIHGTADNILPFNSGYAFQNNPLIGHIVYVYGSGNQYNKALALGYEDWELSTWSNYGHGLKLKGTITANNMRIANNESIRFLYKN